MRASTRGLGPQEEPLPFAAFVQFLRRAWNSPLWQRILRGRDALDGGDAVEEAEGEAPGSPTARRARGESDASASAVRKRRRWVLVDSPLFAGLMGFIVGVNVVTIGFETDFRDGTWPETFATINNFFLLAYLGELVLRLLTHGVASLRDKLTVLDTLLVVAAFVERAASNSGFARALPALRLLRPFRMLSDIHSLRTSRHLQVLVATGYNISITLAWVAVILSALVWSCACFMKHVIGESAEWNGTTDPLTEQPPFGPFDNREYFGSVARSSLTLLQVVTLSQWSNPVVRRVLERYPLLFFFFFCFIIVTSYGLILAVISLNVQDAMAAARIAEGRKMDEERDMKRRWGAQMLNILRQIDTSGDGMLSADELDIALERTNLRDILQELRVPYFDGTGIIRLFDLDGDCLISAEDIVDGLVLMDEEIVPKNYARLGMWSWNLCMRAKALNDRVDNLSNQVRSLRTTLEDAFTASQYFLETRETTELRGRAIKTIRSAPPDEAPKLKGWKPPPKPLYPPQDQAQLLLSFARRYMASPPMSEEAVREYAARDLRKGELPPAPPPFHVQRKQAVEETRRTKDKYDVTPDPGTIGFRSSPVLVRLRAMLASAGL